MISGGTNGYKKFLFEYPFSDLINAVQACILTAKTALQEASLMGTCHTSIAKERKPKISKKMLLPPH